jgi:hypothetical protein
MGHRGPRCSEQQRGSRFTLSRTARQSVAMRSTRDPVDGRICALGGAASEGLIRRVELEAHGTYLDAACRELRPSAMELASAFDVPNSMLRAPLASDDYVASYDLRVRQDEPAADRPQRVQRGGPASSVGDR